ncbi:MAG: long-chain fatty acid--CoA ligase [Pirellulaceae bacterium]
MSTIPTDDGFQLLPNEVTRTDWSSRYPLGVSRSVDIPNVPAWGLLARAAELVPERVATNCLNHCMAYREVDAAASGLAAWLQSHGVGCGDRVGLLLPNSPEYLIGLNGIWRAGGVVVAISPLSTPADVADLMGLTECRTVISLDVLSGLLNDCAGVEHTLLTSLYDYLPGWKRVGYLAARWQRTGRMLPISDEHHHWLWDAIAASSLERVPVETVPHADPAYILSTGGTTGNPKAVTLSHRNIVANAWQQMHWAGATMGEETMLAVLPFFHSYGMSTMLAGGAALGATLIIQPRFEPLRAIKAIELHRPTVFHAVPAMLAAMNQVLRVRRADLSSLKWVISGGATLPAAIGDEFAMHSGALVVEGYGLSEASPVTHVGPLDGTNQTGSIGFPLPNTECRLVDMETGTHEMPVDSVGELAVRGPQVMLGYWKNPSATRAAIRDGWLFTGDLATRDANGFYRIVDRKKDLIVTSGFNVYPADVEEALRNCPDIADVAVVGVPDAERGELVKAFVVLKKNVVWSQTRLEKFCKDKLAAHRRPRLWEVVDDLPRNFLGKVIRRHLRE